MKNKVSYIILLILTAIVTGITVIVSFAKTAGTEESLFNSPAIVFLFAAYVALQIICIISVRGKLNLYRCGFYILHLGIVVMLAGMFVYYIMGDRLESVSVPVGEETYSKIARADVAEDAGDEERFVDLDFYLGISDFKVERYENGMDKYYEAKLKIIKKGIADPQYSLLTVNHPVTVNGWKIYLMNYMEDTTGMHVVIMLKYNPGEYITVAGIWMTIIGALIMCLLKKRRKKDA